MHLSLRIAAAAASVVVAGCAAAGPARTNAIQPTLAQTVDAQLARVEAFAWTPRRLLTWADFKGRPPADTGVVAARTTYTILDAAHCSGARFQYRVVAAFRVKDSWVQQAVLRRPADSARALRHEQTHFDLSELHARRLRRHFAELIAPCKMSQTDWSSAANLMERDEKAAQLKYDAETDNGRHSAQQTRWDKEVDAQLIALTKFVR